MRLLFESAARYMVVGGIAAVVDLTGFHLLMMGGMPLLLSAVASFAGAALFNYSLLSIYAFDSPIWSPRIFAFVLFATIGLAINASVTVLATDIFGFPALLAKTLGIAIAFIVNFLINAFVVFRSLEP